MRSLTPTRPQNWRQLWGLARSIAIYYGVPFRRQTLRNFYGRFIQPGDLCFDVGAHVGNRTQAWLGLGARVIAIEPQPTCLWLLHHLYGRQPKVTIAGTAVGADITTTSMYINQANPTITTLSSSWLHTMKQTAGFTGQEWDATYQVPVTTLDALIEQYGEPAFCKIDVEGFEAAVLQGLTRPLAALSFEFIPSAMPLAHECIAHLSTLGEYGYNWTVAEQHQWAAAVWHPPEKMHQILKNMPADASSGDIYAVRRDKITPMHG